MSRFQHLKSELGIDKKQTQLTRQIHKPKEYDHVKDNVPQITGINFEADLLHLPENKAGQSILLVIVDLANGTFDMEPLAGVVKHTKVIEPVKQPSAVVKKTKKKGRGKKQKTIANKVEEATEEQKKEAKIDSKKVLDAYNKIKARNFIHITPKSTVRMRTDGGKEFGGDFDNALKKDNIFHSITAPYRHQQNANVESLNRQLGRFFNGYMNSKELETGRQYREWTDVIDLIRKELNADRKTRNPVYTPKEYIKRSVDGQTETFNDFLKRPLTASTDTSNQLIRKKKYETEEERKQRETHNMEVEKEENDAPRILQTLSNKPKFKVGDRVHYMLDHPESALGYKQPTPNIRMGDYTFSKFAFPITKVLIYDQGYRYMVDDPKRKEKNNSVSYGENELIKIRQEQNEPILSEIRKKNGILQERIVRGQRQYLVNFVDKKQWIPELDLVQYAPKLINAFVYQDDQHDDAGLRPITVFNQKATKTPLIPLANARPIRRQVSPPRIPVKRIAPVKRAVKVAVAQPAPPPLRRSLRHRQ